MLARMVAAASASSKSRGEGVLKPTMRACVCSRPTRSVRKVWRSYQANATEATTRAVRLARVVIQVSLRTIETSWKRTISRARGPDDPGQLQQLRAHLQSRAR